MVLNETYYPISETNRTARERHKKINYYNKVSKQPYMSQTLSLHLAFSPRIRLFQPAFLHIIPIFNLINSINFRSSHIHVLFRYSKTTPCESSTHRAHTKIHALHFVHKSRSKTRIRKRRYEREIKSRFVCMDVQAPWATPASTTWAPRWPR